MNKKAYISPATIVTTVNVEKMIAQSITATSVEGLTAGGNTEEGTVTTAGVKLNNYNVWDDDWSE